MPTIAIIDDNPEQSGTILTNIEIAIEELKSELNVITSLPFKNPEDYFKFIADKEVCVLILDEKLNDQEIDADGPINYIGSQLVKFLRSNLKDFPIYSVTNFVEADELKENESEFEEVIKRSDFIENTNKYLQRIIRASQNYLREHIDELSKFSELTVKISSGDNDPELIKELLALQVKLDLPISGFQDRNIWLNKYEEEIKALQSLSDEIKSSLNKPL
jgi:hypothetical protein